MADETPPKKVPPVWSAFRQANPDAFGKVTRDPSAVRQLAMIVTRTAFARERFTAHFRKNEEAWVAKEAIKLWTNNLLQAPTPSLTPKSAAEKDLTVNIYLRQARANVRGRAVRRIAAINRIGTKLQNAIVNNARDPYLTQKFRQAANPSTPTLKPKHRRSR